MNTPRDPIEDRILKIVDGLERPKPRPGGRARLLAKIEAHDKSHKLGWSAAWFGRSVPGVPLGWGLATATLLLGVGLVGLGSDRPGQVPVSAVAALAEGAPLELLQDFELYEKLELVEHLDVLDDLDLIDSLPQEKGG